MGEYTMREFNTFGPVNPQVVFDDKLETNPLVAQSGEVFEVSAGDKRLKVYLIPVRDV